MSVVIETTLGDLTVDLFTDERPVACMNFIKLCQLKYYNFNLFHTVQQGFIAQTGDPSGAGDSGSSVWGVVEGSHKRFFEAEYIPKIYHSSAGILSLVSAGKNLVGSQFFFTLGENLTSLDGTHCVIGEVVEGHEVLRKLNDAIVDENFRPYQDIRITHTVVLEDPFPNPRGFQIPARSPSPSAERLKNGRIAADEDIDDTDGKSMEEMQELLAEREAKARATILEIVGDLPDADMAPPENVLFVCKLNPVTTDDDLEIIFSRFGVVKGCEVIRDRKTGDSLQYAFVEFEEQKSCEAAYFKMNNVLIDDRRIHVDFSQSISKVTWRGKGRGVDGDGGKLDFNNLKERNGNKPVNKHRNDSRRDRSDNDKERSRMSSAERRKAREQRHQEQEEQRSKKSQSARSRSRDKNDRNRDRGRDRRMSRSREQTNRRRSPSRQRNDRRRTRSRERNDRRKSPARERSDRRKSASRERNDRCKSPARERNGRRKSPARTQDDRRRATSPYRAGGNRYSPDRRQQESRRSSKDREQRSTLHSKENSQVDRRNRDSKEDQSRYKSKDRKIVEKESKNKTKSKRARSSSSSETSDSSEDSESSSDSSDDSAEDSTSSEERRKRKNKKSKVKKSKAKSKHKSKKKHKK